MRKLLFLAAVGGLTVLTSIPTQAAAAPRMVALAGSEAPGLGRAERLGPEDASRVLDLQVSMQPRDRAGLAAAARGQHPTTPGAVARDFGPAVSSTAAVTTYLTQRGIAVPPVAAGGSLVNFSASVAQAETAFGLTIGRYRDGGTGRVFHANDGPVQLPAGLAAVVNGVHGLDDQHQLRRAASPVPRGQASPVAGALSPADIKSIYNVTSSPLASLPVTGTQADGTGIRVALFELDTFSQANLATYDQQYYGRPLLLPVPILVSGGVPAAQHTDGGEVEVELDIEVIQAVAPGATIQVYEAPNTNQGANAAYQMIAGSGAQAASSSWGMCEPFAGEAETSALHSIFQTAAAAGQSWFAASGDEGAFDCTDPTITDPTKDPYRTILAVDSPASDPNVTGVGGTTLHTAGSNPATYGGETAWSRAGNPGTGGGGGTSIYFGARPRPGSTQWNGGPSEYAWQAGNGVTSPLSNSNRQVPDVSSDADPASGYSIYTVGGWAAVGGTSAAAPAWAAWTALYDQYAGAARLAPLGAANPLLYGAAACPQGHAPFHDVSGGNNLYYSAGPGWDFATGLGSFNAGDLAASVGGLPTAAARVSGVYPATGPAQGGNTVTIRGCGFATSPAVTIGGVAATSVSRLSSTEITASVPAGTAGTAVDVVVTNPGGGGSATLPAAYTYSASPTATRFFFAEGFTGSGYHETLTLLSPAADATATITYQLGSSSTTPKSVSLSRGVPYFEDVNSDVGANQAVSAEVDLSRPGVVERVINFDNGLFQGSTDEVGTPGAAREWDFAEGSTLNQFYEYLTLQNPGVVQGAATVTYFTTDGATIVKTLTLPPASRTTISVRDGAPQSTTNCSPTLSGPNPVGCGVGIGIAGVSARVTSNVPIIAERPMYSSGLDFGAGPIHGGHDAFGAALPGNSWYFAEGTTNAGYFEYLTLQNPDPSNPASVDLNYQTDSGGVFDKYLTVPAHSRATVQVFTGSESSGACSIANQDCGLGRRGGGGIPGVSVHVTSNIGIVAERPMYMYFPAGPVLSQHDAVGATSTGTLFGFAHLNTQPGEYDYLTIQNPNATAATVTLTYLANDPPWAGDGPLSRVISVPGFSRRTVSVYDNNDPGSADPGLPSLGVVVRSTASVLVEKPTYSYIPGGYGATDTPAAEPAGGAF